MSKRLHLMVGLPRSGKSTKAKEFGFPIVEPDAIRLALHGTPFRIEAEPMVWASAKLMVRSLFIAGHDDVVLDATNHTEQRRKEWRNKDWKCVYHVVDTDEMVCLSRAASTGQHYLLDVIPRMAKEINFNL